VQGKRDRVVITDVTLREYGQNVPSQYLPVFNPSLRASVTQRLIQAGLTDIELFSCVHPRVAPAMGREEIEKTLQALGEAPGANLITLVPNRAGYENFHALNLGPGGHNHTMGVFFSAIEAHNLLNLGRPIKKTLDEYQAILTDAASRKIRVVGYISAAFGYLDRGKRDILVADPAALNDYIDLYFTLGAEVVTLSDVQGVAEEKETARVLEAVLKGRKGGEIEKLAYHPHHISGEMALDNTAVAYGMGIRRFDASLGGTGGCVTGAPGNQPTERLLPLLLGLGAWTGVDEKKVSSLAEWVQKALYSRIPPPSG